MLLEEPEKNLKLALRGYKRKQDHHVRFSLLFKASDDIHLDKASVF